MKTLAELNSKWWWRLFKVIIVLFLTGFSLVVSAGYFLFYQTYHPTDISKVENDVNRIVSRIDMTNEAIKQKKGVFSQKDIIELGIKIFPRHDLNKILATYYPDKDIENINSLDISNANIDTGSIWKIPVLILSQDENITINGVSVCTVQNCDSLSNDDIITNNFQKGVNFMVSLELIKSIRNVNDLYKDIKNNITKFERGNGDISFYEIFTKWNEIQDTDNKIFPHKDYLGFLGWIKVITSSIGTIISILIIAFILRGILFYIIFGKFNPEK